MGVDDQNKPKSSTSPLPFNSVLDPLNPIGFFESAFNFASQIADIFDDSKDDEMETKILSLLEDIKKRKREKKLGESEEEDAEKKRLRILEADHGNDNKATDDDDLLPPNKNNGLDMENYSWTQTLGDIIVEVPVPFGTKKKLVVCDIKSKSLRVGVKGQPLLIDGELFEAVKVSESFWTLEDHDTVTILLSKCNQWEWWKSVVKGDPEINTRQCQPAAGVMRRLDGLGYEAERHMRKLLFDYGQKCKGLPTSEDSPEVLKKFIADHPYLNLPQTN